MSASSALWLALLCVFANAFFVAAEFALAKVRPTALETLSKSGDKKATRGLAITRRLDAYLTATQFGITLASLGLGWLGEPALSSYIEVPLRALGATPQVVHGIAVALAFAVITLLHIILGELVPKSLAIQRPEDVVRHTARAMQIFYAMAAPFLIVLNGASNLVLRMAGLPPAENIEGALSLEELRLVVRASLQGDAMSDKKRELVERVLRGADRSVRAVMVPRVDMALLSLADSFDSSIAQIRRHGYSRYPVSENGDPDHITGYVYVKDVMLTDERPRRGLGALRRDVLFTPESRSVVDVLEDMKRTKIPLAIVVDEYGGTSGLVTLENLVEELVGDLQDELDDSERPRVERRADGTIGVGGSVPIDVIDVDGLDVPDDFDLSDTIGSLVVTCLERLARPGDRVRLGEWEIVVEDVRRRRVERVRLVPISQVSMLPPKNED